MWGRVSAVIFSTLLAIGNYKIPQEYYAPYVW